ncbi:hypothetical protein HY003_01735 [Candidatus Saccharibacteria bacterium]|nr:hypothetical protein [Candidatus Saccharibacteria bacterium]MBI3337997.1 hypothetical protein [Candidatus Saccharibacteria bacterium]
MNTREVASPDPETLGYQGIPINERSDFLLPPIIVPTNPSPLDTEVLFNFVRHRLNGKTYGHMSKIALTAYSRDWGEVISLLYPEIEIEQSAGHVYEAVALSLIKVCEDNETNLLGEWHRYIPGTTNRGESNPIIDGRPKCILMATGQIALNSNRM